VPKQFNAGAEGHLASWSDTATRAAVVAFVEAATTEGSAGYIPPKERVATFDNDGTLWCEKPMQIEIGFILERLARMAETDLSLRDRQPWKAAHEKDYAWLGNAITKHYGGDESDAKLLIGGVVQAFGGWTVDEYAEAANTFLRGGRHPTLGRTFTSCAYQPMIELLRYLEANGFTNYIASGGDRDFMRPISEDVYGIPPEHVVGSSNALEYADGAVRYLAQPDVFDDGPVKPVRIWSRVGRRPRVAGGNANGDIPMLEFTGSRALPLVILHDDPEREFDYTTGAEALLTRARENGWIVVSVKNDWATVFAKPSA
jgi:phosphoserine phosphatase